MCAYIGAMLANGEASMLCSAHVFSLPGQWTDQTLIKVSQNDPF